MSEVIVFNTPIESGLRSLVMLVECYPQALDLQRLVYFDYLLVHSEDADGPASLHPATPRRAGELIVRRDLVEKGLYLLLSRGLVNREFDASGISYRASELAGSLIASLRSPYSAQLRDRAEWVVSKFAGQSFADLENFVDRNLDRWGGEFAFTYAGIDDEDQ